MSMAVTAINSTKQTWKRIAVRANSSSILLRNNWIQGLQSTASSKARFSSAQPSYYSSTATISAASLTDQTAQPIIKQPEQPDNDFESPMTTGNTKPRDWEKKNLLGLCMDDLQTTLSTISGVKKYTAKQVWGFIYNKGITDFNDMTALPKDVRAEMKEQFRIDYGRVVTDRVSPEDGTRKYLIGFDDPKAKVESVFIPMNGPRGTQCISSQVGCSLACTFCHTGTQKLLRNLTAGEIVGQYMIPAKEYGDLPLSVNAQRMVNNIVFMGQGEPLYNWRNVKTAIEILTDRNGIALPKNKITVSTSGVVPGLKKLAELGGIQLAISLHATNDKIRDEIVPINRTFPIRLLLDACRDYSKAMEPFNRDSRRITFEYVMLKGVNDSFENARELAKLLSDIPAHVNLIPFNPFPGTSYVSSPRDHIVGFSRIVDELGVPTTIRWPRGLDVMGACGQLRSSFEEGDSKERIAPQPTSSKRRVTA